MTAIASGAASRAMIAVGIQTRFNQLQDASQDASAGALLQKLSVGTNPQVPLLPTLDRL
jgi:hypothetical protein